MIQDDLFYQELRKDEKKITEDDEESQDSHDWIQVVVVEVYKFILSLEDSSNFLAFITCIPGFVKGVLLSICMSSICVGKIALY